MNGDPEVTHERAAIQHMMRRRDGFERGLSLDEAVTRRIFEQVPADIPMRRDDKRLMNW